MANDMFVGLSGLMKGLSGFMPQDDPDVKLMSAQSERRFAESGNHALCRARQKL